VKKEFSISGLRLQFENHKSQAANAFTLVEVLVVVTLLALIVVALMEVFNTTQTAFRASVTQSDVLEGGRAAMDLIAADLKRMSPSPGPSNMNFYAEIPSGYEPLLQSLTASPSNQQRTNVLEQTFILNRDNLNGRDIWIGTGYAVDQASENYIDPLYRFSMTTNVSAADPVALYNIFANDVNSGDFTNMSHLLDGVVHLRVHAFDTNGVWITKNLPANSDVRISTIVPGEVGLYEFYSNALPAAVEVEMGVLEDRTLQRAESLPFQSAAQSNYLAQQAGKVHIFRQRVSIPDVDPAAYQ